MRVLLLASYAPSLVNFRGPFLQALVAAGHDVHAAAPSLPADAATMRRLEEMGIVAHDATLARTGLNPFADFRTLLSLVALMRRMKPDLVLGYTIKPVVWGSLAAALARVPKRFALITGLGYAFTGDVKGRRRLLQTIVRGLYRLALGRAHKVFFQNPDDAALFRELRLVTPETPVVVLNGSGVDVDYYWQMHLPEMPLRFLLIARLLGDKGVREYVEAARRLRAHYPHVGFDLVGEVDSNPDAISIEEAKRWKDAGIVTWHGALKDVRPAIAASHVYVLPSYREGTPRTVLEAMAMGRAIVTTDAPGCRETVIDGENGFLVPVRDADALATAMRRFIDNPKLVASMGERSRAIAEEKYDVHKVNAVMMREMGL